MKHAGRNQTVNDSLLTPAAAQIIANLGQKSGLQDIADKLGIKRVGMAHQAGSDSLVTGEIYWKMHQVVFNGTIDKAKYSGQVWGLNGQLSAVTYYNNNQAQQTPNLNGATIYSNVERSRKSDTSATRQCRCGGSHTWRWRRGVWAIPDGKVMNRLFFFFSVGFFFWMVATGHVAVMQCISFFFFLFSSFLSRNLRD
ncbi:hypothetical protein VTN96DRAFT_6964 [Rasamsonia emersonii]